MNTGKEGKTPGLRTEDSSRASMANKRPVLGTDHRVVPKGAVAAPKALVEQGPFLVWSVHIGGIETQGFIKKFTKAVPSFDVQRKTYPLFDRKLALPQYSHQKTTA